MDPAIVLADVVKTFGAQRAVDGASFEVPRGSLFGLLGRNGAGKTTTLRMLLDIIRPDSGEIRVLGRAPRDGAKDRIGYLPEERGLYPKMRLLDMLEFQGSIKGLAPAEARRRARGFLDRLELAEHVHKKVEELSKGMQQKVQLIAAILAEPELLILDEPFSGMDPVNQDVFRDLILERNRAGTTVVFSTHLLDSAEKLCRELAIVDRGRVVLSGAVGDIKRRFGSDSVQLEFDGDDGFLRDLPGVVGTDAHGRFVEIRLEPGADPQDVLRTAAARVRVRRFEVMSPTLHNIFVRQVGRGSADA